MIWESKYWKRDLIKDAKILDRWAKKKTSTQQYVLFEKKIMISAYAIRKLIEAERLGTDFPIWKFKIAKFLKKTDRKIDYMNTHRIEEFYDFEKTENEEINLMSLVNTIIHSHIFTLELGENGFLNGFLFTSDYTQERCIYSIQLDAFINILEWIGHSDIAQITQIRNDKAKSGFKIKRQYSFKGHLLGKYLPKTKILPLNECLPKVYE